MTTCPAGRLLRWPDGVEYALMPHNVQPATLDLALSTDFATSTFSQMKEIMADTADRKVTRYYPLMWIAIGLFVLILVTSERPENGSFLATMWLLIAIHAYRGDISSAKWTIGFLTVLQVIGLFVRISISNTMFAFIFPMMSRETAALSSGLSFALFGTLFMYARYLENLAVQENTQRLQVSPIVSRGKSFLEMYYQGNRKQFDSTQIDNRTEYEKYADANSKKANATYRTQVGKTLSKQLSLDEKSSWETVIEYFPKIEKLYSNLMLIDPVRAEIFRSERLALKDFFNAEKVYNEVVKQIVTEACGANNGAAMNFFSDLIASGDFVAAGKFMEHSKVLGATNMKDDVVTRFKKKMNFD
jgi:hypothetical protein